MKNICEEGPFVPSKGSQRLVCAFENDLLIEDWSLDKARRILDWTTCDDETLRVTRVDMAALLGEYPQNVVLPDAINGVRVTELGPFAFVKPATVSAIKGRREARFSKVASLRLPRWLRHLGCSALAAIQPEDLYLGPTLERIDGFGFSRVGGNGSLGVCRMHVDPHNIAYVDVEGSLYTKDMEQLVFAAQPYAQDVVVPDIVRIIGTEAFQYGSMGVRSISLGPDLELVCSTPSKACLWRCPPQSKTSEVAGKKGYYVVTGRYLKVDDYELDVNAEGEATLVRYNGDDAFLTVPEILGGRPVVALGPRALPDGIVSLRLPNTMKTICSNNPGARLTHLVLPSKLAVVGSNVFCQTILEAPVVIPASCKSIGEGSFSQCECAFEGRNARVYVCAPALSDCFLPDARLYDFESYDEAVIGRSIDKHKVVGGSMAYMNIAQKRRSQQEKVHVALVRIAYPMALGEEARRYYEEYLEEHVADMVGFLLKSGDQDLLAALLESSNLPSSILMKCLEAFQAASYTPGVAQIIEYSTRREARDERSRFAL